jgi:hypothetical protein
LALFRTIRLCGDSALAARRRQIGFVSHISLSRDPGLPPGRVELGSFGAIAPTGRVGLAPPIPLGGCKLGSFRTFDRAKLGLFVQPARASPSGGPQAFLNPQSKIRNPQWKNWLCFAEAYCMYDLP